MSKFSHLDMTSEPTQECHTLVQAFLLSPKIFHYWKLTHDDGGKNNCSLSNSKHASWLEKK